MTTRSGRASSHGDPDMWVDGEIEMTIQTGDPNSNDTCERFVGAVLNLGSNTWDETTITVKHLKNATLESGREIDGLTVADAKALARCLEGVLAKLPIATRFFREAVEIPLARNSRAPKAV